MNGETGMNDKPSTLGELREAGYEPRTVKDEIRQNLVRMIRAGEDPFPGILGYERTVVPALQNAILARHDVILLGLRGQAKTRILRSLVNLLDEEIPVIAGSDLNESPFEPFTSFGRRIAASAGADVPVLWLRREQRYREKLATPDVTIADLIGDIDPVKAATLKKSFADEEVIHYGIIPRTNRGIFAINELPDLQPRIQVGLLNILEERDLQIRGFPVRIPLDVLMVFSANPEDYTNRGNIITPLKDRIASQILTHYPASVAVAAAITEQEAWTDRTLDGVTVLLPDDVKLLIEEVAFVARRSELVDQTSGVSARMPIAARELLVSNLERRALKTGEKVVAPRLVDLFATLPAVTGKVEMVFEGEQQGPEIVAKKLVGDAVKSLFESRFPPVEGPRTRAEKARRRPDDDDELGVLGAERFGGEKRAARAPEPPPSGPYDAIVAAFAGDRKIVLSDDTPFSEHVKALESVPGLSDFVLSHAKPRDHYERAFLMELVLEGLVQNLRIAREDLDSTITYAEIAKFNLMRSRG
ncbi:MAG TPA: magnesium chelatase [Thermoanaerobaculia bacterium]|nr:magnesium chelatase [Thermoanaerobaculia bacterium]